MHRSNFIYVFSIAIALCEHALSTESRKGVFPVYIQKIPQWIDPQNTTVESQTRDDKEAKTVEKNVDSTPKDANVIEVKQNDTKIKTTPQESDSSTSKQSTQEHKDTSSPNESVISLPFRRRRMSNESNTPENNALNKIKIKLKLTKTKAELKEKDEAAKKKGFPKDLDKSKEANQDTPTITMPASTKTNKVMPFAINSKEERDNVKREQIFQWLYNARPLLSNETRLWANLKPKESKKSDKDHEIKSQKDIEKLDDENNKEAEPQVQKDNKKSNDDKKEIVFYTVETESKEKKTPATTKRSETGTDEHFAVSKMSTTTATKTATNNSDEFDSSMGNGLHFDSTKSEGKKSKEEKSEEVDTKAKFASKQDTDTDMTSDETAEDVTEKREASQTQRKDGRTVQRFVPMNDGKSSSESGSVF